MNAIDVVEKVTGLVIVMKEEDQEAEVIHQEGDILHVDPAQEVIQVDLAQDLVQDLDLGLDPDPDLVKVVQDLEVIQDHIPAIVEVEEDLEVVPYVVQEVADLVLTLEKDHIHQDLNHHALDPEVDQDLFPILLHVHVLDLDLVHIVVHVLVLVLDLILEVVHVLVQDLIQDLHQSQIHQLEVKMVKNQWMKIKHKSILRMIK